MKDNASDGLQLGSSHHYFTVASLIATVHMIMIASIYLPIPAAQGIRETLIFTSVS
jgi:hypothetical protein